MIVLKILGIALGVVFLLIAIVLAISLNIIIKKDNKSNGFNFYFKILFFTFGKEPSSENKDNKFVNSLLELAGVSKISNVENMKDNAEEKGVSATISDTIGIFVELIKQICFVFKHLKLKKLYINCLCAGDDSAEIAMDYGVACAVLYPLSGFLHSIMKVNKRKEKIAVSCDFNSTEAEFVIDTVISIRVLYILLAFINLVKEESRKKIQEMR